MTGLYDFPKVNHMSILPLVQICNLCKCKIESSRDHRAALSGLGSV